MALKRINKVSQLKQAKKAVSAHLVKKTIKKMLLIYFSCEKKGITRLGKRSTS